MFETGYVQPEVDYNTSESRLTHMGEVAREIYCMGQTRIS